MRTTGSRTAGRSSTTRSLPTISAFRSPNNSRGQEQLHPSQHGRWLLGVSHVGHDVSRTTKLPTTRPHRRSSASTSVTFRNNFVHHNALDGIWYDSDNTNALIEGNRVEDNGRNGIFYEIERAATIRNNMIRRSGDTGIFISTSKNVETYGNTLEDNWRGIQVLSQLWRSWAAARSALTWQTIQPTITA